MIMMNRITSQLLMGTLFVDKPKWYKHCGHLIFYLLRVQIHKPIGAMIHTHTHTHTGII